MVSGRIEDLLQQHITQIRNLQEELHSGREQQDEKINMAPALRTSEYQQRYPEWSCGFRRSGPSNQLCGSSKPRYNLPWPALVASRPCLLRDLAVGPTLRLGSGDHHHLSTEPRPLYNTDNQTGETIIPLERAPHPQASYTRDGRPQTVLDSNTPQKPLVQPTTLPYKGRPLRPTKGRL
jgi:hypothetical protein